MEALKWEKDKTPYYIFSCMKCGRALYVKTTQKTKKCLSCMQNHLVSNLQDCSQKVFGLSNAIAEIKKIQHNLAIQEFNHSPNLRSDNEFRVATSSTKSVNSFQKLSEANDFETEYEKKFRILLQDLFSRFTKFPKYMIYIMSSDYHIPNSEIPLLLSKFTYKGILIALPEQYYTLSVER